MPRKTASPQKRAAPKRTAAARTPAAKKTAAAKPTSPARSTATPPVATPASPGAAKTQQVAPEARSPGGACPRCGSSTFAPEQRIRAEGNRTVRYTILVCERGHTFAKPVSR